jgi:hypothetical protein
MCSFHILLVALLLVRQLCEDRVEELSRNALIGEFEESGIVCQQGTAATIRPSRSSFREASRQKNVLFSYTLQGLLLVRQLCEDRVEELSRNALIGEFEESGIGCFNL